MATVTARTAAGADAASHASRNYGRIIEQTWIWSVVGYSLVRFFIAWGAFSEHGANAWIFGLIDVGTAWPYGKAVAVVCKRVANGDWARMPVPLVATVIMFFAPYAYLWFAAGEMPSGMRLGLGICVSVLFIAASTGVIVKSRKLRREANKAAMDVQEAADANIRLAGVSADDELVIDLRDQVPTEPLIDLTDGHATLERSTPKSS